MTLDWQVKPFVMTWYSRILLQLALAKTNLPLRIEFEGARQLPSWEAAWEDWEEGSRHEAGVRWNLRREVQLTHRTGRMPTQAEANRLLDTLLKLNPTDIGQRMFNDNQRRAYWACAYRAIVHAARDLRSWMPSLDEGSPR